MARVTIEDCLLYIPNRFKIVELAAKRARELAEGARTTSGGDTAAQHKVTVLALREIATGDYNETTQSEKFDEFSLFEDESESDSDDIADNKDFEADTSASEAPETSSGESEQL